MPGVGDPKIVDLITHRPKTDEVVLVMSEMRPWGTRGELLVDLQEKVHTYLDFVETGQLAKKFPHLAGKKIRIRLDSSERPGEKELQFLNRVKKEWLSPLGIALEWNVYDSEEGPYEIL